MKKFFAIIASILLTVSCTTSSNNGYGYNANPSEPEQQKNTESYAERAERARMTTTMNLYGSDGKLKGCVSAFKGVFDGHTWYVFFDNLAVPAVVHDPNCKCMQK